MQADWSTYIENTRNKGPSWLLVRTLGMIGPEQIHSALDFGSGALCDSRYLLKEGIRHVTAVDQVMPTGVLAFMAANAFTFIRSKFADYAFPAGRFNLVNAQYSLPFAPPSSFPSVWKRLIGTLAKGGIFTGQLFGQHDEWNKPASAMTFHSETEARALCEGLEILVWRTRDSLGKTADGLAKHWHTFDIIAKKL